MSLLQHRIQEVMSHCGWSIQQTAAIAGVTRAAVYQWLGRSGKETREIRGVDVANRLARASGFSATWIATGDGPKITGTDSIRLMPWPFEQIDEASLLSLDKQDLRNLEAAILIAAGHLGLNVKRRH